MASCDIESKLEYSVNVAFWWTLWQEAQKPIEEGRPVCEKHQCWRGLLICPMCVNELEVQKEAAVKVFKWIEGRARAWLKHCRIARPAGLLLCDRVEEALVVMEGEVGK